MDGGLLTIEEAAAALNLTKARVHQLLAAGALDGVPLPAGRRRHAPGAHRVRAESVQRLMVSNTAARRRPSLLDLNWPGVEPTSNPSVRTELANREPSQSDEGSWTREEAQAAVGAARAAAQEMKVRLDTMRAQLRAERSRSAQLLQITGDLLELVRSSASSADSLDDVAEGYSQALTQLLSPSWPADR